MTDQRWGELTGRILEDLTGVVDQLRRVIGAWPNDPHYVRDKIGALVDAAIVLHQRVMLPSTACGVAVDSDQVDGDGQAAYILCEAWHLPADHTGPHDPYRGTRARLLDEIDDYETSAVRHARRLRWSVAAGGHDGLDALNEHAEDVTASTGQLLARLVDHRGATRRR